MEALKFLGFNISRATIKQASTQSTTDLFSNPTNSGVTITPNNALNISTVFSCIKVLSEGVSCLPVHLYRQNKKEKIKAKDHPLYNILHLQPNKEIVAVNLYETYVLHLCLRGVFYAQIIRSVGGKIS